MAVQSGDLLVISRSGTLYKTTVTDFLNYVLSNAGTSQYNVADITARNALGDLSLGDRVFVEDATDDVTVGSGWAIYIWQAPNTWTKIAEEEGLDVVAGGANLSYSANPSNGVVASDSGTDATIPAADGTNAGLLLPAGFTKLGYISVTQAVDLDAIEAAAHAAVTTSGTSSSNPIVATGQALSFSIANLTSAP